MTSISELCHKQTRFEKGFCGGHMRGNEEAKQ